VLGIGPAAVWHISRDDHLFVNLYIATEAENRPEGTRLNMRYTHHFSPGAQARLVESRVLYANLLADVNRRSSWHG
jgi:hypothetical protein